MGIQPVAVNDTEEDIFKDDGRSLKVVESHVLQERTIGIFGAVSLIVNKIIGSGQVPACTIFHHHVTNFQSAASSRLQQPSSDWPEVQVWH